MFPKHLQKIQVERMSEMKRILSFHECDGWKFYACLFFIIFKLCCICLQTKFALDVLKSDFILFTYAAATYCIPVVGLVKLRSFLNHNLKIRQMHAVIKDKFWDINTIGNKELSKNLIDRLSVISKIVAHHAIVSLGLCTVLTIFPLVQYPDDKKKQPSALWFPFDANRTPVYQLIYVVLAISNYISVTANLNSDILYVYFTQHLAVQYILLQNMLEHVTDVPEIVGPYRYESEKYQRIIKGRLRICIDHHNLLMEFARGIQGVYSFCLAVQLSLSILSLVFTAFILSMEQNDVAKMLKLLIFALALTIQVLLCNLNGTEVETQPETVAISAFQCEWFYGNKSFRRELLLLMVRSQKQFIISALGLTQINNACMVMVYRTVFSILTVFRKITK